MDETAKQARPVGWLDKAAAGRTLDEQLADVRRDGSHAAPSVLREMALTANGVGRPARTAVNALVFGCYRPFSTPFIVRDAVRLLNRLGVGFTWLEKEYCCGLPLLPQAQGERAGALREAARDCIRANVAAAAELGAQKLVYCCAGCAHAAKGALPGQAAGHAYILDALLDALDGRPLAVAPRRIAYFEGCHGSYRKPYPEAGLDWPRYRRFLGGLGGLTLVDVPQAMCCKAMAGKIVDWIADRGCEAVVCACSACNVAMRQAGQGRIRVQSYLEVLAETLGEDQTCRQT